jgi:hypothetical protein
VTRSWTFTDLEFQLVCDQYRHGDLPSPFVFTSRIRLLDDYEREQAQTRERLRDMIDGDFEAMATVIAKPEVFIVVHAWDDQDFENPDQRNRVHAARRGPSGYLLTQQPGETLWHSGGVTVTECDPRTLADAVVGQLPKAEAGLQREIMVNAAQPADDSFDTTVAVFSDDDGNDDESARSAAFFNTPATATGIVKVLQGRSKFGPRGIVESGLLWRDLPGDGRYVMPLDHPAPVAAGMGSDGLIAWVGAEVDRILAHMDTPLEFQE